MLGLHSSVCPGSGKVFCLSVCTRYKVKIEFRKNRLDRDRYNEKFNVNLSTNCIVHITFCWRKLDSSHFHNFHYSAEKIPGNRISL